jgi:hypothetical protein
MTNDIFFHDKILKNCELNRSLAFATGGWMNGIQ